MKKLLLIVSLLYSVLLQAQMTRTTTAVPTFANGTVQALLYIPPDTTHKMPLCVFLHGSGESGTNLSKIYASTTAGGPAYEIEQGRVPTGGFTNPKTGLQQQMAFLCPQTNNGWSESGDDANVTLTFFVASHSWVDTNAIFLCGLSSGAGGDMEYYGHLDNVETPGNTSQPRRWKLAAVCPMSVATNAYQSGWANKGVADSTSAWMFGDENNDTYGEVTLNWSNAVNALRANYSHLTHQPIFNTGHGPWERFFNPGYRETFTPPGSSVAYTMNIYEFMLTQIRSGAPVTTPSANAGSNQTIQLPTNSATLNGTGTAGSGHTISTYGWVQVSGPGTATITPSSSSSTGTTIVSSLIQGVYTFRLTVTNNIAATATSTVTVTVNAATLPVANAGSNQSITLPAASFTLDGTGSTGPVTTYAWTQISGPNSSNIVSPSSATTSVTAFIQGVYTYQLSVNSGASTSTVQITVNSASQYPPCGTGTKHNLVFNGGTYFLHAPEIWGYAPGDTILIPTVHTSADTLFSFSVDDYQGNPACPLVIGPADGNQVFFRLNTGVSSNAIHISNSSYVKINGKLKGNAVGIFIEEDPYIRYQGGVGLQVDERSKNVDAQYLWIHNVSIGILCETNGDCADSLNYPNWVLDSIGFHHNHIIGTWNEGMYLGNTSPDNAATSYDIRPVVCNGITTYPRPMRNGHMKVDSNFVDSTGRGGIQLASASSGISEIWGNTVKHNGMNGDDAQGTAISIGTYTRAYIHNNTCINTYTWGIASLGGSGTGIPQRIENNTIDSSGFLAHYQLATTSRPSIDTRTEPVFPPDLGWPQYIFIDTKRIDDTDSTIVWIKNNLLGIEQNPTQGIVIQNDRNTLQLTGGNIICNNILIATSALASIFIDPSAAGFVYSTNCGSAPPVVNAGSNQSITLPVNSVNLSGTAIPSGGTISSYKWTQLSGPAGATIVSSTSASTSVTGLTQGVFVFNLHAVDSNNLTGDAQVTITVTSIAPPTNCNCLILNKILK